jgi:hypothetical protein
LNPAGQVNGFCSAKSTIPAMEEIRVGRKICKIQVNWGQQEKIAGFECKGSGMGERLLLTCIVLITGLVPVI